MRYLEAHRTRLGCDTPDEVFAHFMRTLQESITQWDHFVDWHCVLRHAGDLGDDLRLLGSLVGSESIENDLACLLRQHPTVARVLPFLVACGRPVVKVLVGYGPNRLDYRWFVFHSQATCDDKHIAAMVEFAKSSGLLSLLHDRKVSSLVDYAVGVAVGLESKTREFSNAQAMRAIVGHFLADACTRHGLQHLAETTSREIMNEFGIDVSEDNPKRVIDFAVWNGVRLYLVQTAFCPWEPWEERAILEENGAFARRRQEDGHMFIWATDGEFWRSAKKALRKAFNRIDYVLNLEMVSTGLLEDIVLRHER